VFECHDKSNVCLKSVAIKYKYKYL
jgi:hypothetical protein